MCVREADGILNVSGVKGRVPLTTQMLLETSGKNRTDEQQNIKYWELFFLGA